MQHGEQVEANRALVDEEAVNRLLENLPELLTSDEQAQVRECARLAVEQQTRAAEIGLEAARRHATTDVEEATRREAIARFFVMVMYRQLETAAAENMIEM